VAAPPPPAAPLPRHALHAVAGPELAALPEEMQEAVIADEVLSAMLGHGGTFIHVDASGKAAVSPHVPVAMAALVARILCVTAAAATLDEVAAFEYAQQSKGQSLIKGAVAEAVREVHMKYLSDVTLLGERTAARRMPLARLVADAQVVCYPVNRLAQLFDAVSMEMAGHQLLDQLHRQHGRCAGNADDERLLGFVVRRAAKPYIEMLAGWMFEGRLDDPYCEFFVHEEPDMADKDELTRWSSRFTARKSATPGFLAAGGAWKAAYNAGRYCNLLRESGGAMPSVAAAGRFFEWGDAAALTRVVEAASAEASARLIEYLVGKCHLLDRLASLKTYFLHGKGDWVVNFLDSADALLFKSPAAVKAYSVNVVLQSEIAKSCKNDPFHGDIRSRLDRRTLVEEIAEARRLDADLAKMPGTTEQPRMSARLSTGARPLDGSRKVIDVLSLEVRSTWPLSLVLNGVFTGQLNWIFRLLLWCKVAERSLNGPSWKQMAQVPAAMALRQRLLHFLRSYQFYAMHTILGEQWARLVERVGSATGIRDIAVSTVDFAQNSFQCLAFKSETGFEALTNILDLVIRFSNAGTRMAGGRAPATLAADTDRCGREFLAQLAVMGDPTKPGYAALVPLLTMLDFSGFYEKARIFRVRAAAVADDHVQQQRQRAQEEEEAAGRASQ
jgi:gamma-tubulin complex component 2